MSTSPQPGPDEQDAGTPVWLNDFPHTAAGEEAVTRRAFTRYLVAGSGVFAAATVGAAAWTSLRDLDDGTPQAIVELDQVPENGAHLFRYPGPHDPAVLIRLPEGELVAYSQKCTHLGCVVFYEPDETELVCPCHEGIFDAATGAAIAGPPERALPTIEVEVRDGTVWAIGVTR
ncbi:MAG: Rieske 2Fe-2S domain-containing protein [Acidimicrobiales bacterium]|nr:Rieske 2Fe-2S domain-containing protein [Acidimicrobiales bacterium]